MISTGGYGVQVMPAINFADGAQLAGRGPGEAISGFNSGIGLVNAIQNTRQKAILSPIEVDAARARLAQIQAETELNQANAPYRNALAKIEMTKASMPIRQKTGETIKGFAEVDADGKPTGRVHQAVQDEGFDYDPQTGAKTPYTAISRPLVTADQAALNTSLMENRTALAEINRQKAVAAEAAQAARAKQLEGMFTLNKQKAETAKTQGEQKLAQGDRKLDQGQQRIDMPHYDKTLTLDPNGNVVINPVNIKTGQLGVPIYTHQKPNTINPDAWMNPTDGTKVNPVAPKKVSGIGALYDRAKAGISSLLGSTPTDQTVTTLPDIPSSTGDDLLDHELNSLIPTGSIQTSAVPPGASIARPTYIVRQKQ